MTTNLDLDRLMAERCMGWHQEGEHWYGTEEINGVTVTSLPLISLWHPTTDIAQAMMCAEKLGRDWMLIHRDNDKKYCLLFGWSGWDWADTPALAICKAIAAALKGEK